MLPGSGSEVGLPPPDPDPEVGGDGKKSAGSRSRAMAAELTLVASRKEQTHVFILETL